MKTKFLSLVMLCMVSALSLKAGDDQKEKFMVAGNCGMCESRIEKAAMEVKGVNAASWDKETRMVEVSFDSGKTDLHQIHMAIARVGHDTEMHRADDKVYDKLPGCCKYERLDSQSTEHQQ